MSQDLPQSWEHQDGWFPYEVTFMHPKVWEALETTYFPVEEMGPGTGSSLPMDMRWFSGRDRTRLPAQGSCYTWNLFAVSNCLTLSYSLMGATPGGAPYGVTIFGVNNMYSVALLEWGVQQWQVQVPSDLMNSSCASLGPCGVHVIYNLMHFHLAEIPGTVALLRWRILEKGLQPRGCGTTELRSLVALLPSGSP